MTTTQSMLFAVLFTALGFWLGWQSRAWSVRWRFNRKWDAAVREHEKEQP